MKPSTEDHMAILTKNHRPSLTKYNTITGKNKEIKPFYVSAVPYSQIKLRFKECRVRY
jgi:hypothetical protein